MRLRKASLPILGFRLFNPPELSLLRLRAVPEWEGASRGSGWAGAGGRTGWAV